MNPARSEKGFEARAAKLRQRADESSGFERVLALLDLAEDVATRTAVRALPATEEVLELLNGEECRDAQDAARLAARVRAAAVLQQAGDLDRAISESQDALDRVAEDDRVTRALAIRTVGAARFQRDELAEAMEHFERALALVRPESGVRAETLITRLLMDLARGQYRLGETDEAHTTIIEARKRALRGRDRPAEGICELNLGNISWQYGDLESALGHYRAALRIQRELGAIQNLALSLHNLACVHYETQDNESALETIDDALIEEDELGRSLVRPRLHLLRGRALMNLGRNDDAAAAMLESLEENRRQNISGGIAQSASALAEVHSRMGNHAEARRWIEHAEESLEPVNDRLIRGRVYAGLARAELELGEPERALAHLRDLSVEGTDTRSRRLRADLEMVASLTHEALGQDHEALDHYRAALVLERELLTEGSRVRAERLRMLHRLEQGRYREELLADSKVELERRVAERTEELQAKNAELITSIESHADLEAKLRHTQKMEAIGRLAGGVAHDFNNLLVVIQGYGERLLRSATPGELGWEEATQILGAATRASRLTSQLLAFSRRDAYREAVCDLGSLISGMQHMLQRLIGEDVQISVDAPTGATPVLGDTGRFEQLALDLVVHARDSMPKGGRLELKLEEHPAGTIQFTVWHEDFADAPNPEVLDVSAALGDARAIIESAGGEMRVRSAAGGGTSILARFPKHDPDGDSTAITDDAPRSTANGKRILLVDDEEGVRDLVASSLRQIGYHVTEAIDGRDALQRATDEERPFDLVVCDVVMPRMGGQALFEALRARGRSDPFLFVSGYTDQSDSFLEAHADEIELLAKPFLLRQLEERIASRLARNGGS